MKVLVWQWGRQGAGPRFAACLAEGLRQQPHLEVALSLCRDAEIMTGEAPPQCELSVSTYRGMASCLLRLLTAPLALLPLLLRLRRIRPQLAICAMPGPLDFLMAMALRLLGCRVVVIVHDADGHPGDGFPGQMALQLLLCRLSGGLVVLCAHVGRRLRQQGLVRPARPLIPFRHPPFGFDVPSGARMPGPSRLLCFGRLRDYKGLDLLAAAMALLPAELPVCVRVVGCGAESPALDILRSCRNVSVENRWVPEAEIGALLGWSDAMILPYREASQSGVAAAALAAARPIIATNVGGLAEQLSAAPQAILCEPDPAGLAHAIQAWIHNPPLPATPPDTAADWRAAGRELLEAIATALPAKQVFATRPQLGVAHGLD